jgi:hypothetical protein
MEELELNPNRRYYTKEELVQGLKSQIARNNNQAVKALLTVYRNQTFEEQTVQETIEDNGIGFNGTDAEFCSSLAENYLRFHRLSDKQYNSLRKVMQKYARQLITQSIDLGKIKCKCRGKYYW